MFYFDEFNIFLIYLLFWSCLIFIGFGIPVSVLLTRLEIRREKVFSFAEAFNEFCCFSSASTIFLPFNDQLACSCILLLKMQNAAKKQITFIFIFGMEITVFFVKISYKKTKLGQVGVPTWESLMRCLWGLISKATGAQARICRQILVKLLAYFDK